MWQFWVSLIVGLWLLLGQGAMNIQVQKESFNVLYLLTGIFTFVPGLWLFVQPIKGVLKVLSVIVGLAGIWLGLTSFISGLQGVVNAIIVGIILVVVGFWGAVTKQSS